ncbi:hypothetical protein GCM10009744_46540 [Kribbella alba]|uniref:Uncharacterized protein n=1 Tax=Kribbella alba TaxID=190197 RepID=A0ABN2FKR4_9ACTN
MRWGVQPSGLDEALGSVGLSSKTLRSKGGDSGVVAMASTRWMKTSSIPTVGKANSAKRRRTLASWWQHVLPRDPGGCDGLVQRQVCLPASGGPGRRLTV